MNMITKTLLAFLLLAGLTACGSGAVLNTNADQVTSAAAEIADFQLPDGYSPDFTARLMGYTLAGFTPGDGHSHLYLIQSSNEEDSVHLESMLDQVAPASSDPQTRMTVLETHPVSVRGEETTLVISEGTNSEGDTYRQAAVTFEGKGGPALLVFSEPVDGWDPATVEALLASVQ